MGSKPWDQPGSLFSEKDLFFVREMEMVEKPKKKRKEKEQPNKIARGSREDWAHSVID